ncbi:hypothetical protein IU438_18050 [Nocardia cyriacigeorgica]|uniref:hypothetical protein n=1 Tax=Nocardia cyriacigeorgica TaxID=135487 RepID=UPI001895BA2D|nr:hypothetical protein [Nocardia cyriacigeorgica]MBF6397694.1 hypothetical protein [Nocardia cyriacigeorgica]MBF6402648.1 hypothetical protein [Nocardia cyriacigeorgica]
MPDIRELTAKLNEALGIENPAATELEPWQEFVTPEEFAAIQDSLRKQIEHTYVEVSGSAIRIRMTGWFGWKDIDYPSYIFTIGKTDDGSVMPGSILQTGVAIALADRICNFVEVVSVSVGQGVSAENDNEGDEVMAEIGFETIYNSRNADEVRKLIKSSAADLMKEWAAAELSRFVRG